MDGTTKNDHSLDMVFSRISVEGGIVEGGGLLPIEK